ncbi:MAG: ROK family protein [Planctomycetota bacterium]|nr:ROK family protein [Planctomycetota bacterium]
MPTAVSRPGEPEPVVAIDIGGTKCMAALGSESGQIFVRKRFEVRKREAAWIEKEIRAAVEYLRSAEPARFAAVRACGIGFGGPVEGRRLFSHHVAGWENIDLAGGIERTYGWNTKIDNDANVAALGELIFGAGRGLTDIVYFTVSTGIGGGVISGGRILRGSRGLAGELGHMNLVLGGPPCTCGNSGCLESLASGWAIAARARSAAVEDGQKAAKLLEIAGGNAENISAKMVFQAAGAGCPVSRDIIDQAIRHLARAVGNAINLFDPQAVIIGGGISLAGGALFEPLRRCVKSYVMRTRGGEVPVLPAELGDMSVLLGAIALARPRQSSASAGCL